MTPKPLSRAALDLDAALTPKMTRVTLAAALGVSPQAISAWLSGVAQPTADKMAKIEELTGIPMRAWTETPAKAPRRKGAA